KDTVLEEVAAALANSDPKARIDAVVALGQLGTPAALDRLGRVLTADPEEAVREAAALRVAGCVKPDPATAVGWLRKGLEDSSPRVLRAALDMLYRMPGGSGATAEVLTHLTHADVAVRAAAARALGGIANTNPEARDALLCASADADLEVARA